MIESEVIEKASTKNHLNAKFSSILNRFCIIDQKKDPTGKLQVEFK